MPGDRLRAAEPAFPTDFATSGEPGNLVFCLFAVDFTLVLVTGFALGAVEDPGFETSGVLGAALPVTFFLVGCFDALGFFLDMGVGFFPSSFFICGLGFCVVFGAVFFVDGVSSS